MSELLELTAAQAAEGVRTGAVDPGELWSAYRERALAALIAIGLAVITATRRSPTLPVAASVITATTGILATLLVLYRILNQPGPNEFIEVKLPAFLGFLCVLAIAAGGWRSMRDESWEDAPVPTDVRPAPPAEGPREPAPPPEAEPRA